MALHRTEPSPAIPPGCPLDRVLGFLAQAWMADVVYALGRVPSLHFGAIRRAIPGKVSARMLSRRLRELEQLALITRVAATTGRREVSYALTAEGRLLDTAIMRFAALLEETPLPAVLPPRG